MTEGGPSFFEGLSPTEVEQVVAQTPVPSNVAADMGADTVIAVRPAGQAGALDAGPPRAAPLALPRLAAAFP